MKEKIIKVAKEFNIDIIGFTGIEDFLEDGRRVQKRLEEGKLSSFTSKNIHSLISPKLVWNLAESIISIGISYNYPINHRDLTGSEGGNIASVAWGLDYHKVLLDKMDSIMKGIKNFYPKLQYQAYVDNAPLLDRAVAYRSGVGFYGKNNTIINPIHGSYVFLGHMLTNIKIKYSNNPVKLGCAKCNKCILACPTKALGQHGLNANRCVSYLTQKKGILRKWERKSIGEHIYGCDICQEVCPYNKKALTSMHKEFQPKEKLIYPSIEFILKMDKAQFIQNYGNTAAGWRGRNILQRNAIIVAGNNKNNDHKELLIKTLENPSWVKRLYSMYSLLEYDDLERLVKSKLNEEDKDFIDTFYKYKD